MEATMIPEGMLEGDDAVFPCKGCGEILEEGKAFELAGNRWHIDCFRCNSCRTLLDSDANLLLLGDGSLICNNCTYSCSVCKQKIEDLAILTGEKQAFCAKCFRCRNCKRKIENLKYAKTSQGIFCMQCHESLMARRRKKNQAKAAAAGGSARTPSSASPHGIPLEKRLPALPQHIASQTLSPDVELRNPLDGSAADSTDISSFSDFKLNQSAKPYDDQKDTLLLSPRAYGDAPLDSQSENQDTPDDDSGFTVPVALDPNPMQAPPRTKGIETNGRDFFGATQPSSANFRNDFVDLLGPNTRSTSQDRERSRSRGSQHIAYQEKGRVPSADAASDNQRRRHDSGSSARSPSQQTTGPSSADRSRFPPSRELEDANGDKFRLQPAPKRKSSGSKTTGTGAELSSHIADQTRSLPVADSGLATTASADHGRVASADLGLPKRKASMKRSPLASPGLDQFAFERPARNDSIKQNATQPRINLEAQHPESPQMQGLQGAPQAVIGRQEPGYDKPFAKNSLSAPAPGVDKDGVPARSPRRPLSGPMANIVTSDGIREEAAARSTPAAHDLGHLSKGSITSIQTDQFDSSRPESPSVSQHTLTETSPEDYGNDGDGSGKLFRSLSKAVKHARSQSDKLGTVSSPKWQGKSRNASVDIGSPHPAATAEGVNVELRNQLRYSQQKIIELEAEKIALQVRVNGSDEIVQVNTELSQKRSTMAMIDSQREMVMKELEVMTENLQKIKGGTGAVDVDQLRSTVMGEFGASLERLKTNIADQIEELMAKKNELTKDITDLIQMKDRGNHEYESLSNRNRELARHNEQLIASIQGVYQQQAKSNGTGHPGQNSNGLGIYAPGKDPSFDGRSVDGLSSQFSGDTEYDQTGVVSQPQLVNMRKGQAKKFISWKKGRDTVAKNVTKGLKGAFGSNPNSAMLRDEPLQEGVPYNSLPTEAAPQTGTTPLAPSRSGLDPKGKDGWTFKGGIMGQPPAKSIAAQRNDTPPSSTVQTNAPSLSSSAVAASSAATPALPADSNVFGSDLTSRCEFEKRVIPSIVMSCIDEVSLRGLDQEGIYRKSGSATQVKVIQAGFEKDPTGYDISDPDLDIHVVTGCLKQYFRRLPNPLITFECYDAFLECVRVETDSEAERANMVKHVVKMLPKCHRETLEFLCFHLCAVMENQADNLMTPLNLAVVFAPTIMRPLSIERELVDTSFQRTAVQLLLENFTTIFEPPLSAS